MRGTTNTVMLFSTQYFRIIFRSLQFEEGIEETVKWYLENQEWMDNVTSGDYQKYYDNMYSNR